MPSIPAELVSWRRAAHDPAGLKYVGRDDALATESGELCRGIQVPAGFGNYGGHGVTGNPEGDGGLGTLVVQGAVFTDQAAEFKSPTPQPMGSITTYGNLPTATTVRAATAMSEGSTPAGVRT